MPRRCLSVAWVVPAPASSQPGPKSPNSALSLVREVFWDAAEQTLIKLPLAGTQGKSGGVLEFWFIFHVQMIILPRQARDKDREYSKQVARFLAELGLLRNRTLFQASAVQLSAGQLFTPALPAGTGDTIDLTASFDLADLAAAPAGAEAGANATRTFGFVVLAENRCGKCVFGGQF
jgi:hypothetical protein